MFTRISCIALAAASALQTGCANDSPERQSTQQSEALSIGSLTLSQLQADVHDIDQSYDATGRFDSNAGVKIAFANYQAEVTHARSGGTTAALSNYRVWEAGNTYLLAKNVLLSREVDDKVSLAAKTNADTVVASVRRMVGDDPAVAEISGRAARFVNGRDVTGIPTYGFKPLVEIDVWEGDTDRIRARVGASVSGVHVDYSTRSHPQPIELDIVGEKARIVAMKFRAQYPDADIARVAGTTHQTMVGGALSSGGSSFVLGKPTAYIIVDTKDGDAQERLQALVPATFEGLPVSIVNVGAPATPKARNADEQALLDAYQELSRFSAVYGSQKKYYKWTSGELKGRLIFDKPARTRVSSSSAVEQLRFDLVRLDCQFNCTIQSFQSAQEAFDAKNRQLTYDGTWE